MKVLIETLDINNNLAQTTLNSSTIYVECHYAECRDIFIVMLNVVMLSVIMLNVVAPFKLPNSIKYLQNWSCIFYFLFEEGIFSVLYLDLKNAMEIGWGLFPKRVHIRVQFGTQTLLK
jgi:hypothetical protein